MEEKPIIEEELEDDSDNLVEAKVFQIDESWPDDVKKQIEQLNEMSAIINREIPESADDTQNDEDADEDDYDDEDDYEEEDNEEDTTSTLSAEETETFNDIF